LLREGQDLLLLAIGSTVYPSLRAAERLEAEGIHVAVINNRFLKPLDGELICHWAKRVGRVLTVEENALLGGFGSAVLELLQEGGLFSVPVERLGIPDLFVEHGSQSLLRRKFGIDEKGIFDKAKEMIEKERPAFVHSNRVKASVKRLFPDPK
jgi:1-deoxy-D-xylulose-5-phosphate synthase